MAVTPQSPQATPPMPTSPLLSVQGVSKRFAVRKGFFNRTVGHIHALSDVSLNVYPGETLGIVGESGCGKSTLGRAILQLIRPSEGAVWFDGTDLTQLSQRALRPWRKHMQMVFQNPYSSLNPRMSIETILAEPFIIHQTAKGPQRMREIKALLSNTGLPESVLGRFPHELSGGQRQRVCIARALALKPKLIVADEPVSALDVSVQAQILNLMQDLKAEYGLTYIFIAHNLSVVEYISDRLAVMYLGQIVETGPAQAVYQQPRHPYTQALLSAVAVPDPSYDTGRRILLEGDLPSPQNPPSGCRFHTRCRHQTEICATTPPSPVDFSSGHWAACHHAREISPIF